MLQTCNEVNAEKARLAGVFIKRRQLCIQVGTSKRVEQITFITILQKILFAKNKFIHS